MDLTRNYIEIPGLKLPPFRNEPDTLPLPLPSLAHVIPAYILNRGPRGLPCPGPSGAAPGPGHVGSYGHAQVTRRNSTSTCLSSRTVGEGSSSTPRGSQCPDVQEIRKARTENYVNAAHNVPEQSGSSTQDDEAPTLAPLGNGTGDNDDDRNGPDPAAKKKGTEYVTCNQPGCVKQITKKFRADHQKLHHFEGDRVRLVQDDVRCKTCADKKRRCRVAVHPRDADINTLRCELCIKNRETCSFLQEFSLVSVEKEALHPVLEGT